MRINFYSKIHWLELLYEGINKHIHIIIVAKKLQESQIVIVMLTVFIGAKRPTLEIFVVSSHDHH